MGPRWESLHHAPLCSCSKLLSDPKKGLLEPKDGQGQPHRTVSVPCGALVVGWVATLAAAPVSGLLLFNLFLLKSGSGAILCSLCHNAVISACLLLCSQNDISGPESGFPNPQMRAANGTAAAPVLHLPQALKTFVLESDSGIKRELCWPGLHSHLLSES